MSTAARNRTNAVWLREQLDDLAWHVVLCSTPLSPAEVRAAVLAIRAGESWRLWAARRRAADAQLARAVRGW